MAYSVYKLSGKNSHKIKQIYEDFESKAIDVYGFEFYPIDFDTFSAALSQGLLNALVLYDDDIPESILIYSISEIDETIELNVIHSLSFENLVEKNNLLIKALINFTDPKEIVLISYPMLGEQSEYAKYITKLGFKLVSQSIFRFNLDDTTSLKIFKNKHVKTPSDLKLVRWSEKYYESAVVLIHKAFKDTTDALYDRRFLSLSGCRDVLEKITKDIYGNMLRDASFLLLDNECPVAFCFANLSSPQIANIPLIGCREEFTSMGLGSFLLKQSVGTIIEKVVEGKLSVVEINATTASENNASMRMYRSLGFKEDVSYIHSFYEF